MQTTGKCTLLACRQQAGWALQPWQGQPMLQHVLVVRHQVEQRAGQRQQGMQTLRAGSCGDTAMRFSGFLAARTELSAG